MQDGLTIRLLGEAELEAQGRRLALPPSKKTRALLGYLALSGRPHRREKLCGLFWDVADDPRAALRWSLTKLRDVVDQGGRTRLIADREQVQLDLSDVRVDALEVRRALSGEPEQLSTSALEQALGWFRGELLEGLELADFHAYHVWCLAEREQLRRLQTGVLSTLLARAGAYPERALPLARQLVDLDPLDTRARALFMELLHASGRAPEAEAEARTNQRLLGGRAQGERDAPEPAARESQVGLPRRAERALPLIGRASELSALSALVSEPGPLRACLLEAEAGVGKTRLLASAIGGLPAKALLESAAHERTPGSPYGPWLALLRTSPAARADAELHALLEGLTERGETAPASVREQLFRGVSMFLERASQSQRRLVLVLDDTHWLDEGSAELLLHVSQSCAALPISVLLAARPGALADNPDVLRVMRALRRQGKLLELRLAAFAPEETAALLQSIASAADPAEVQRDSAGNPLFALELARAAAAAGAEAAAGAPLAGEPKPAPPRAVPVSITRLVRDRISVLPTEVADVLRWASVLGADFDPAQLERLLALDAESFVSALEQLERHDYVRFEANRCSFAHEIVRAAVYDGLSSPRRQLMHTKVARQLSAESDPSGALAGELSRHAALAGDAGLAVRACITAGQRCLRLSAGVDAHALSRRGLAYVAGLVEPERTTLEIELLQLAIQARRPEPNEALGERLAWLAARALELGAISHASSATYLRALLKWEDGFPADARRFTSEVERISRLGGIHQRIQGLGDAACCLTRLERDLLEAEAYVLEAERLGEQGGIQVSSVPLARGRLQCYRGELAEAEATLGVARQLAQQEGDRLGEMHVLEDLLEVQLARAELGLLARGTARDDGAARQTACELLALGERSRPGSEVAFARAAIELVDFAASQAPDRPELEAAIAALECADAKQRSAYVLARAAQLCLSRGALDRAAEQAERAIALARLLELRSDAALALVVRAQVAALRAEADVLARARAELQAAAALPLSARARASVEAALLRLGSRPRRSQMEHVIVERVFVEPVDLAAMVAAGQANWACYEMRRVKLLRSLLSRDGLRMICEYLAPDAESVREANESAGLAYERIWTAKPFDPDASV